MPWGSVSWRFSVSETGTHTKTCFLYSSRFAVYTSGKTPFYELFMLFGLRRGPRSKFRLEAARVGPIDEFVGRGLCPEAPFRNTAGYSSDAPYQPAQVFRDSPPSHLSMSHGLMFARTLCRSLAEQSLNLDSWPCVRIDPVP